MRPTPRRSRPARHAAFALLAFALLHAGPAFSQPDDASEGPPPVTSTYVLRNARIVQAPGRVIERGSVLVRNGRIAEVGLSVSTPFDAEVIQADSLVVYAGFIDGLSHIGIPAPRQEEGQRQERVPRPGDPPDDRAGIQPDRDARDLLDAGEKSIADWRAVGLTLTHTVPHGQMLPGRGALVLLGGDDARAMVFRGPASLYAQMDGARGVYPATVMGVMAKWRDLYRNAERGRAMAARFAAAPGDHPRPPYDPSQEALFPVIDGALPVFFGVESAKNVYRAMRLADELGFALVLGGVQEGWMLTGALSERPTPVFFSLDLPDPIKEDDKTAADSASADSAAADSAAGAPSGALARTVDHGDVEAELARLRARRKEALAQHLRAPADWSAAGIRFGFSTQEARARDFKPGLRRLIEHGLSEDDALAALTTDAAALLGIDESVGTVEAGKVANLVVTTGPYFDEDSAVRFVFVDGRKYAYESGAKPGGGVPAEGLVLAGAWSYSVESPGNASSGTLVLRGEPADLEGTITNSQISEERPLSDVSVDGTTLSFSFSVDMQGTTMNIQVTATVDGDAMEGTMSVGEFGAFPFEATRTGDPDR